MHIRRSLLKRIFFGILYLTLFLGIATVSLAEQKEEGMYFSILSVENNIGGDFKGTITGQFENSDVLVRVPDIESGKGFGILIGGYKEKLAGELYYTCTNHDTSFLFSDLNGNGFYDFGEESVYYRDGECQVIGINVKYFFVNLFENNIRFFGQLGFFIPKISIEEGAYKLNNYNDTADVTFTGYGGDLGIGILIHLHPNLAINCGAVFRYIRIKEATAFDQDRVPDDNMYSSSQSYSIGLNYYF